MAGTWSTTWTDTIAAVVARALEAARAETSRPSLICCKTVIGWGAPNKAGHGGDARRSPRREEIAAARRNSAGTPRRSWSRTTSRRLGTRAERGRASRQEWHTRFERYREQLSRSSRAEYLRRMRGDLPDGLVAARARRASRCRAARPKIWRRARHRSELSRVLRRYCRSFIGGSADLTGSNNTPTRARRPITADDSAGNYLHYGVREFGMARHDEWHCRCTAVSFPYSGTFLVFSDYARNALRMAALMACADIFVLTHDSIGLGEDGPTHQPIEQLASLRAMPNMRRLAALRRRGDARCLARGCRAHHGPDGARAQPAEPAAGRPVRARAVAAIARGGYILRDSEAAAELVLIATGSEIRLALAAYEELATSGVKVRVVSMPCMEAFEQEAASYRDHVLPTLG